MDIHNYDKRYQAALRQVQNADIPERNKQLILDFGKDLVLEGASKPRLLRYHNVLKIVAQLLGKEFDKAEIADLKGIVATIQQRSDYSPWTKQAYKIIIRRFYKWLAGTKTFPPIVDWITIGVKRSEKPLPSEGDLLSESDIQKILQVANHPRDKAMIAMLWESGARISEIGNLKLCNIEFDEHGTLISVRGKTGSRKIRLMYSTQFLSIWMSMHPFRSNKDAQLWINIGTTNHNKPMVYGAIRKLLMHLFQKAEIRKRCNPHLFRHSRATFMAHHLTEFQMNQYFGWFQGSRMPSTYVHMSGRDVDSAILKMNGFKGEIKNEESKLVPQRCPRCETMNCNDNTYCFKCGGLLDVKFAAELDERRNKVLEMRSDSDNLMNVLLKDPDVQRLLVEKMARLNAEM